jgi:hypothetical protein
MQFEFLNTVRLSRYSRVLGTSFHCCWAVNNKNKQLLKLFAENRSFYLKSGYLQYIGSFQKRSIPPPTEEIENNPLPPFGHP